MPVTRLEITSEKPFAGGESFGDVGSYTQIDGIAHFAVDPLHEANETIADIKLAPRNAQGMVEFSADFRILRPDDPARGNQPAAPRRAEPGQGPGTAQHQQRARHRSRRAPGPGQRLPDAPRLHRRLVRLAARCPRRPRPAAHHGSPRPWRTASRWKGGLS